MKNNLKKTVKLIILLVFITAAVVVVLAACSEKPDKAAHGERTLADFEHSKVAVMTGSAQEKMAHDYLPEAEVCYYNSTADVAEAVSSGRADCGILGSTVTRSMLKTNPHLTTLPDHFTGAPLGAIFNKDGSRDELKSQFNEFLNEIKADGTLDQIIYIWDKSGTEYDPDMPDIDELPNVNGVVKAATCAVVEPFSFIKDGTFAGIDIDIMARFCEKYGYSLEINDSQVASIVLDISSGSRDIGMSALMMTEERMESVDFSEPYYDSYSLLIYKAEDVAAGAGLIESFEKTFIREGRWQMILNGLLTTAKIFVLAAVLGSLLAFGFCMLYRKNLKPVNTALSVYVRIFQGTPVLVLLLIFFYVIFGNGSLSGTVVAIIVFALNSAAFFFEGMRAGINSIDPGQMEAAQALGFSDNQAFFRFVFPQAARHFLPVYGGELISLLKGTSVVGYVAIQDLTKVGDIIRSRTYEPLFPLITTAVIYFLVSMLIFFIIKKAAKALSPDKLNRRVKGVDTNA